MQKILIVLITIHFLETIKVGLHVPTSGEQYAALVEQAIEQVLIVIAYAFRVFLIEVTTGFF